MPLDTAWALAEIETFLQLTLLSRPSYGNGPRAGSEDSITAAASVTERIFDRVLPE